MNVDDIAIAAEKCDMLLYTRTWGLRSAEARDGLWLIAEMKRLGIPGTTRASFALYNTTEEVDRLAQDLKKALRMLA
jgi:selenocysteine lyase/cysteine desulfurase